MALAARIQEKKQQLKANPEGTLVRTANGQLYRERPNVDGEYSAELLKSTSLVLIEAAPGMQQTLFLA